MNDSSFRAFVFSWLLTLCSTASAPAQDQPRFRSGVEVTSVDVIVVDGSGRPIPDLGTADFTVRVDGVPRRIVSAEWVPHISMAPGRSSMASSPGASNSKPIPDGGRLVLIVIDQPNIRPGGAIGHRAAINTFIDRLQPSDPVGIVNLGAGARSVSFTTDRDQVKRVVATSVGGVPYPPSSKTSGEQTFDTLRALIGSVREIDAPKTIVLISQGLVFSEDARPSIAALEREAAAARTTIYALRLDERVRDIRQKEPDPRLGPTLTGEPPSTERLPDLPFPAGPAGDGGPDGVEAGGELEAVAAATGGAMFTISMSADRALARIESELSGFYLLGVESAAADGDGRPHSLKVDVSRRGVTVRAGRSLPSRTP